MGHKFLLVGLTTRALAESAWRAGYSFISLDYFGDYDQRQFCRNLSLLRDLGQPYSVRALLEAARDLEYEAVVYTASLENHPAVVAELADGKELFGNDPATLARVRDPAEILPFLARRGFAVPRTIFPGDLLPGAGRWLYKPVRGGGGAGIRRWDGRREPDERHLLQEFIEGRPASLSFVANGRDCVVIGWSEQFIGSGDFGAGGFWYVGNIVPLDVPSTLLEEARAIARALTAEFGLRGLNSFDFVLRDGRAYVVEVNPRYSASMELMEREGRVNVFQLHVDACCADALPRADYVAGRLSGFRGKAILYAERDVTVGDTRTWLRRDIRDVPHPGESIKRGHPICTLFAADHSREACYRALLAQANELRQELYR
jgi:predicted ATP-grasp superfamily ATP-dependent carboligase